MAAQLFYQCYTEMTDIFVIASLQNKISSEHQ